MLGHLVVHMSRSTIGMHRHWWALSIGVAMVANKKALFVTLVHRIPRFDAHWSQFFADFDWFVVITSRLDAYTCISRYGNFCANDNDNNNDNKQQWRHDQLLYPLAHVRGVMRGGWWFYHAEEGMGDYKYSMQFNTIELGRLLVLETIPSGIRSLKAR